MEDVSDDGRVERGVADRKEFEGGPFQDEEGVRTLGAEADQFVGETPAAVRTHEVGKEFGQIGLALHEGSVGVPVEGVVGGGERGDPVGNADSRGPRSHRGRRTIPADVKGGNGQRPLFAGVDQDCPVTLHGETPSRP